MKKILILFGTRPEAIKMAPIIKMASQMPREFTLASCVTGQHRKMLDQILDVFEIRRFCNLIQGLTPYGMQIIEHSLF